MRALLLLALVPFYSHAGTVEFAYRNSTSALEGERRSVGIQGRRDGGFNLEAACGSAAQKCECLFFKSEEDYSPLRSTSLGISVPNNSLSCLIPGDHEMPDQIHQVAVRLRSGEVLVDRVNIKTSLRLEDVLGAKLAKEKVRGIFRYSCNKTFFEGEGVNQFSITCVPGQHLGIISAKYDYYTYRSGEDSNQGAGDFPFSQSICGRNSFLKTQCTGNTPELRYGFYKESVPPFVTGVTMTRAPEGDNLASIYGFAAMPDSAGHCPVGLAKARAYEAQPASVIPSGPSCPAEGCPSSFINSGGTLNNKVVEILQPMNFSVSRQPNVIPCGADGNCTSAEFGGLVAVQSVMYTPLAPVVCVIPPELLDGIF